jgi:hypothetical protein
MDGLDELTADEERPILAGEVFRATGLGVDEFRRRWLAGEYRDNPDPRITSAAMLLPTEGNVR